MQSAANPSPCYLANIRVIFENNSEPVAKKAKRPCGAGTSDHRANFDIREKQGGSLQSNTVLPAKNRERKDRAAKPPTSPASRLHGCPRLPPHTTRLVFVRQGVGRFKAGRRYHSLIWDAVSSWRLPRRSSRSLPQGSLSASRLNGFCLPGANGQFLATHDDLAEARKPRPRNWDTADHVTSLLHWRGRLRCSRTACLEARSEISRSCFWVTGIRAQEA